MRRRPCRLCKQDTSDNVVTGVKTRRYLGIRLELGKEVTPYCRAHLLEEFQRAFLAASAKMVIIHPEWSEAASCVYGYLGMRELKQRGLYRGFLERAFAMSPALCACRRAEAQVAYAPPGMVPRVSLPYGTFPDFEHVSGCPIPLCLRCVLERIEPPLRSFHGDFDEGVFLPTQEDGAYFSCVI